MLRNSDKKKYALYPEYKVCDELNSKRQKKKQKKEILEGLKSSLSTDPSTLKIIYRYFVSLPCESAHSDHPTGEAAGFAQKLHPLIISKISDMVYAGITNITDIKRSLRWYVQHDVAKQIGQTLKITDRSLYPTDRDIRNHVHIAKRAMEFSKFDQENLQLKLKKWKTDFPSQCVYCRPYIKKESCSPDDKFDDISDKQMSEQIFNGIGGLNQITCSQHFLLVLQEEWQKRLLQRYGNTICLIDATYKTTRYDLPLFFICVKTNVGYTIVAEFIVQGEEAEQIREAIEVLKSWNTNWCPSYFMCDYSEAELLALEAAFSNVVVYLCDFHREQAWERWVKSKQSSTDALTKDEGDLLLSLLRSCATAPPCEDDSLPVDALYQQAIVELKSSTVWKNHVTVQFWLESTWLNIPKVSAQYRIHAACIDS